MLYNTPEYYLEVGLVKTALVTSFGVGVGILRLRLALCWFLGECILSSLIDYL